MVVDKTYVSIITQLGKYNRLESNLFNDMYKE